MDKPLVIHVRTLNAARKAAIDASSDYLNTAVSALPLPLPLPSTPAGADLTLPRRVTRV